MITTSLCWRCAHLDWDTRNEYGAFGQCRAFPTGIPREVKIGKVKHRTPYPGDNGVTFEQASEEEMTRRHSEIEGPTP